MSGYVNAIHPHLTIEECVERYPILTANLKEVMLGTTGEAGSTIRNYRDGFDFGCEACSHSGLTPLDRIRQAIRLRAMFRTSRLRQGVQIFGKDRPVY